MNSEPLSFELPIPDRALSPNARGHWARIAPIIKAHRTTAKIEALRVLEGRVAPRWGRARLNVMLFHLTKRTPDPDNFIASLKPYLDGLADAGIVANDRGLWPERPIFFQCDRLPHVRLTITPENV